MREDGCELDRIFLCDKADYAPKDEAELPTTIDKGVMETWYETRESLMDTSRIDLADHSAVSIEAELVPATDGWKYFAEGSGHSGLGYLEWAPVGQGIQAGSGLLKYDFQIVEPGNYQVLLRGRIKDPSNRPDTLDPDGNDIWLKLTGGKNIDGKAGLKDDWNNVAILGHPVGFSWKTNIDVDKVHPINPICRSFDRGTYSIELSGRSQGYAIDRVMILKYDKEPIVDFDASKRTLDSQTESSFRPR